MNGPYELIYGFVHCVGRTRYHAGYADSRAEARRWVAQHTAGTAIPLGVPDADPVRWCPVRHCHMKRQRPWFGFRSTDGAMSIGQTSARITHSPPGNASETTGIVEAASMRDQEDDGTQG